MVGSNRRAELAAKIESAADKIGQSAGSVIVFMALVAAMAFGIALAVLAVSRG
jgi:hypothetical protein